MSKKHRVLFVCMGNICRSPTGEAVLRHLVGQRGLADRFEIDSAGTIGYHAGEPPDGRMTAAAAGRGITLAGRARQFVPADFGRFDLIVAMDNANYRDIVAQDPDGTGTERVRLCCDFIAGAEGEDVPDPYYGGRAGFERVLDMVQDACEGIIEQLEGGTTA